MGRSNFPAPSFVRSVIPSLLIVVVCCGGSTASTGKSPLSVSLRPLIGKNQPPEWRQVPDSVQIVATDSIRLTVIASDPEEGPMAISVLNAPEFVLVFDSGTGASAVTIAPSIGDVGSYVLILLVLDTAGASDTALINIQVQRLNHPPDWNDEEIDTIQVLEEGFISRLLTVSDPNGDPLSVNAYTELPNALIYSSPDEYEFTVAPGIGQSGIWLVTLIAFDGDLADTLLLPVVVTALPYNHPPVWDEPDIDSVSLLEGGHFSMSVSVSDSDGNSIVVSNTSELTTVLTQLGQGSYKLDLTPKVGESGLMHATLIASDGRNSDTLRIQVLVRFDPDSNHSPQLIDPPYAITINVGEDSIVQLRAVDLDDDPLTFSTQSLPEFVALSERASSTPGERLADLHVSPRFFDLGTYRVQVLVSDGELIDSVEIRIWVTNDNMRPGIILEDRYHTVEGGTLVVTLAAVDHNGTTVALRAISLPQNATFVDNHNNGGTFRFNPSYTQAGEYDVGFIASDGVLTDTAYTTIIVGNTLRPPQFASLSPQTVNEGSTIRLRIVATDPDDDPISLSATDLPANASFVDSTNGRGSITFSPVIGQIGPFEIAVVASDGVVADTLQIQITSLQITVPPDSAADVDFVTEEVAHYNSANAIDQLHVEDLDLDGVGEVLFREIVEGVPVLRIWSPAGDSLWVLPPVGTGIKSYTLRSGDEQIEPVVFTSDNMLLALSELTWELQATVPDSLTRVQWLPQNTTGAVALGTAPQLVSGNFTNPIGCSYYSSDQFSRSLILTPTGTSRRWTSFGYAQAAQFDFGSMLPVFQDGVQTDLLIYSYRTHSMYEGWGCGIPHESQSVYLSLSAFMAGDSIPNQIVNSLSYYCFSDWCPSTPNPYDRLVGLSKWNGSSESELRLCYAGMPGVTSPYQSEYTYRLTILTRGESWTATEMGFNLAAAPTRGGVITTADEGIEHMLLAPDAGFGYLVSIPDATLKGRLAMPVPGRCKTGYVLDDTHRDVLFSTAGGIKVYRLQDYIAPRDSVLVHRVPEDYPRIQDAINAAISGDTVLVAPGAYPGSIDFLGKDICVKSEAGAQMTEIRPASTTLPNVRIAAYESENAILDGFTIYGGTTTMLLIGNGARPIIRNNIFQNYQGSAVVVDVKSAGSVITRNFFLNNASGVGITVGASGSGRVYNNTFDRNGIGISNDNPSTEFQNNIVTHSKGAGISGLFAISDYNNVWSNGLDYDSKYGRKTTVGGHDLHVDPLYQNAHVGDFRLTENSICIDNGNPAPEYMDADGSTGDIGATAHLPTAYPRAVDLVVQVEDRWHLIDDSPEFAWTYKDLSPSTQVAYEVEVGTDNVWPGAEAWSSGAIASSHSTAIYTGNAFENGQDYFVRVRVSNGTMWGGWAYDGFHTNGLSAIPIGVFPANGTFVNPKSLTLRVQLESDPDGDSITCEFSISDDPDLVAPVHGYLRTVLGETIAESDTLNLLTTGQTYWWRARVSDGLETSEWAPAWEFITKAGSISVPIQQPSLQEAVLAVANGDTVLVEPGDYHVNLTLGAKGFTILSTSGPANTILRLIEPNEPTIHYYRGRLPHILEGFTITGSEVFAIEAYDAEPRILRNVFKSNIGAVRAENASRINISGNTFVGNGILSQSHAAITLDGCDSIVINRNLIYAGPSNGQLRIEGSTGTVSNNTMVVSRGYGVVVRRGKIKLYNNIITDAQWVAISEYNPGNVVADYNCTFGNAADYDDAIPGPGSVFADPQFVNPAAADFRLSANSPCIDAGHPDPQYNDPDGSRNDIGAFPYVPGLAAKLSDDLNQDGVIDVRDAVRLIDQTIRVAHTTGETQPADLNRVREMIDRLWGRANREQQK